MNNSNPSPPPPASAPSGPATASRNVPTPVAATATMTMTQTETPPQNDQVLRLTLQARPNVTWDEAVIDNEGLGRKSSKRCCIFHKQRAFGESSTDSSEDDKGNDSDGSSSSGGPVKGDGSSRPIARKKKVHGVPSKPRVPDSQRFHA